MDFQKFEEGNHFVTGAEQILVNMCYLLQGIRFRKISNIWNDVQSYSRRL